MQSGIMPLFRASTVISDSRTTFRTTDKEIVVEVPGSLMKRLVSLCDGTTSYDEVVRLLNEEWDEGAVRGSLEMLMEEQVLIDARHLERDVWRVVANPQLFPSGLTKQEVSNLVKLAAERCASESGESNYVVEESPLRTLLLRRKSCRPFSGEAVAFEGLVSMLWSGYGQFVPEESKGFHRTVPSAGALYPLFIHLVLFEETGGLKPAVYRICYSQDGKVGVTVVSEDVFCCARSFLDPVNALKGAQGVIVISGSFSITGEKYGNRSLLYVPLEAGHAAQNIMLEGVIQGIATVEIGGFVDMLLKQALQLPAEYMPLTTIAFGKEAALSEVVPADPFLEVDWALPVSEGYCPPFAMASARLIGRRSWSHGRASSPDLALTKARSEAKEWASCGCIPELLKGRFSDLAMALDPRNVIRFHSSQYRMKGFPFAPFKVENEYDWTKGYEMSTGSQVAILADLVYFPYFPQRPYYCYANSSGCAAHPNEQTAIETAALELVERDSFMNVYLTQMARPTVLTETLPEDIRERIARLQEWGFKVWIKDHSLDLAPAVLVFAQSDELFYTICASCASFDIEDAVSHALREIEAPIMARLQNGPPEPVRPCEVAMPLDHGRLYAQRQYYQRANFLVSGGEDIQFEEIGGGVSRSWDTFLSRISQKNWRIIIVPLHLSEKYGGNGGLHIVRCLIPGMVPMTFGYRQEPAGMQRIYEISQRFGGEKRTYGELTKFPHPFE